MRPIELPPELAAELRDLPSSVPSGVQAQTLPLGQAGVVNHPGRGLTVDRILSAFDAAEDGYPAEMCDIFDDRITVDGHLRDALESRVDDAARCGWVLIPGGRTKADERAAAMLADHMAEVPDLIETFSHQLRENWYGYAFSEIDWRLEERRFYPYFKPLPARRFRFRRADDQPLLVNDEGAVTGTYLEPQGEPLWPGKWWGSVRRTFQGKAVMSGLMRTAVFWSLFKQMSVRDWLVFANRFGVPFAWATHDSNITDKGRRALKKMMKNLGSDGWAMFQRGVEVTITEARKSGGADGVHGSMINLCNAEISKLITGGTLVSENQGIGSYAATSQHGDRAYKRIAGDAQRLAETFEACVGRPFVKFNGMSAAPPSLHMHTVRTMDPLSRMKLFSVVRNELGVPVSRAQVYQETQIKPPTGAEDEVPGQIAAPAGGDAPGGGEESEQ